MQFIFDVKLNLHLFVYLFIHSFKILDFHGFVVFLQIN